MRYGRQGRVLLPPRRAHPGFRRIQPLRPIGRADQNKEHLVGGDRLRREAEERSPIRPVPSRAGIPSPTTPSPPAPPPGCPTPHKPGGSRGGRGERSLSSLPGSPSARKGPPHASAPSPEHGHYAALRSRPATPRRFPETCKTAAPSLRGPRRGPGEEAALGAWRRRRPATERSWAGLRPQAVPTGHQRGHRRSLLKLGRAQSPGPSAFQGPQGPGWQQELTARGASFGIWLHIVISDIFQTYNKGFLLATLFLN